MCIIIPLATELPYWGLDPMNLNREHIMVLYTVAYDGKRKINETNDLGLLVSNEIRN